MTRSPRRRILFNPEGSRLPWIVQYDHPGHARWWTDLARFATHDEANAYLREISDRDRILIEAER